MLSPHPVARGEVVYPGEVDELVEVDAPELYAEFVLELPYRCPPDSELVLRDHLLLDRQGVGAAGVCPHVRKGDLLARPLLQQQTPVARSEEEDAERSMQEGPGR